MEKSLSTDDAPHADDASGGLSKGPGADLRARAAALVARWLVPAVAVCVAVSHAWFVTRRVLRDHHYVGDDVVLFYQARTMPFLEHVSTPIDTHPVPLHRALTYVLAWLAPMNYAAGTATLMALHLLAAFLLYRVLKALFPSAAAPLFAASYAAHVYIPALFSFWTAGMHRLPFLVFTAAAFLAYHRYREAPSWKSAAGVLASIAVAMGFFEKGALIAPTLVAVELCLWPSTSPQTRRSVAKLFAATAVLVGLYVVFWRLAVPAPLQKLSFDPFFLVAHTQVSWVVLSRSLLGLTVQSAALPVALLAVYAAVTIALRPWNAVVFAVGFLTVSVHLAATGISDARAGYWQLVLAAFCHRYYPESFFVLVILLAAAWHFAVEGPTKPWARALFGARARPVAAVLGSVALVAVTISAQLNWSSFTREHSDERQLVNYRRHVEESIARMRSAGVPLVFVDGNVPKIVDPFQGWTARHSVMLKAMGVEAKFAPPGRGVYRFTTIGTVTKSLKE